jgi:hypothetical protein
MMMPTSPQSWFGTAGCVTIFRALVTAPIVALVVGCSGAGQPASAPSSSGLTPSTGVSPGVSTTGVPTTTEVSTTVSRAELDDLKAGLLTVGDLPPGYDEMPRPDIDLGTVQGCRLLDADHSKGAQAEATAVFKNDTTGSSIVETILRMSEDGARQAMSELARAPRECSKYSANVAGLEISVTTTSLDFPPLGDETVALRMAADAGLLVIEQHMVAVRRGGIEILISYGSALGPVDRAVTESVTRTAYAKVAAR